MAKSQKLEEFGAVSILGNETFNGFSANLLQIKEALIDLLNDCFHHQVVFE